MNIKGRPVLKSQSVKKNFGYQTLYQIILLILPFFTEPFMTRRLGATALGNYSYVVSIASYFCLFAALGITSYGVRAIAGSKSDETTLRKTFWSLYLVHFIVSLVVLFAYFLFALFSTENQHLYLIVSLYVFSTVFDITWLFSGLENFSFVVLVNLFIKIITTTLLFLVIKTPSDIFCYSWIQVGGVLASHALLVPFAIKMVPPIKVTFGDCLIHLKPMLILFISSVATSLYTTFDKTILGLEATKEDVAFYVYADKIVSIPKAIMGSLITVLLPRICTLFAEGKIDESKKYIKIAFQFVSLIGMGTMFGLLGIGQELAVVYYGSDFAETGEMLLWMSPLAYIVLIGQIAIFGYMMPAKKEKQITINIVIAAVINVGSSALLVHYIGPIGAIIGTILAESFVTALNVCSAKEVISWKMIVFSLIPYLVFGGIMYLYLFLLQKFWAPSIIQLIVSIITGFLLFISLSLAYLFFFSSDKDYARNFLKNLFHKKNKAPLQ